MRDRYTAVEGQVVRLYQRFYYNNQLIDPISINPIQIKPAANSSYILYSLLPIKETKGVYYVQFTIPNSSPSGTYYNNIFSVQIALGYRDWQDVWSYNLTGSFETIVNDFYIAPAFSLATSNLGVLAFNFSLDNTEIGVGSIDYLTATIAEKTSQLSAGTDIFPNGEMQIYRGGATFSEWVLADHNPTSNEYRIPINAVGYEPGTYSAKLRLNIPWHQLNTSAIISSKYGTSKFNPTSDERIILDVDGNIQTIDLPATATRATIVGSTIEWEKFAYIDSDVIYGNNTFISDLIFDVDGTTLTIPLNGTTKSISEIVTAINSVSLAIIGYNVATIVNGSQIRISSDKVINSNDYNDIKPFQLKLYTSFDISVPAINQLISVNSLYGNCVAATAAYIIIENASWTPDLWNGGAIFISGGPSGATVTSVEYLGSHVVITDPAGIFSNLTDYGYANPVAISSDNPNNQFVVNVSPNGISAGDQFVNLPVGSWTPSNVVDIVNGVSPLNHAQITSNKYVSSFTFPSDQTFSFIVNDLSGNLVTVYVDFSAGSITLADTIILINSAISSYSADAVATTVMINNQQHLTIKSNVIGTTSYLEIQNTLSNTILGFVPSFSSGGDKLSNATMIYDSTSKKLKLVGDYTGSASQIILRESNTNNPRANKALGFAETEVIANGTDNSGAEIIGKNGNNVVSIIPSTRANITSVATFPISIVGTAYLKLYIDTTWKTISITGLNQTANDIANQINSGWGSSIASVVAGQVQITSPSYGKKSIVAVQCYSSFLQDANFLYLHFDAGSDTIFFLDANVFTHNAIVNGTTFYDGTMTYTFDSSSKLEASDMLVPSGYEIGCKFASILTGIDYHNPLTIRPPSVAPFVVSFINWATGNVGAEGNDLWKLEINAIEHDIVVPSAISTMQGIASTLTSNIPQIQATLTSTPINFDIKTLAVGNSAHLNINDSGASEYFGWTSAIAKLKQALNLIDNTLPQLLSPVPKWTGRFGQTITAIDSILCNEKNTALTTNSSCRIYDSSFRSGTVEYIEVESTNNKSLMNFSNIAGTRSLPASFDINSLNQNIKICNYNLSGYKTFDFNIPVGTYTPTTLINNILQYEMLTFNNSNVYLVLNVGDYIVQPYSSTYSFLGSGAWGKVKALLGNNTVAFEYLPSTLVTFTAPLSTDFNIISSGMQEVDINGHRGFLSGKFVVDGIWYGMLITDTYLPTTGNIVTCVNTGATATIATVVKENVEFDLNQRIGIGVYTPALHKLIFPISPAIPISNVDWLKFFNFSINSNGCLEITDNLAACTPAGSNSGFLWLQPCSSWSTLGFDPNYETTGIYSKSNGGALISGVPVDYSIGTNATAPTIWADNPVSNILCFNTQNNHLLLDIDSYTGQNINLNNTTIPVYKTLYDIIDKINPYPTIVGKRFDNFTATASFVNFILDIGSSIGIPISFTVGTTYTLDDVISLLNSDSAFSAKALASSWENRLRITALNSADMIKIYDRANGSTINVFLGFPVNGIRSNAATSTLTGSIVWNSNNKLAISSNLIPSPSINSYITLDSYSDGSYANETLGFLVDGVTVYAVLANTGYSPSDIVAIVNAIYGGQTVASSSNNSNLTFNSINTGTSSYIELKQGTTQYFRDVFGLTFQKKCGSTKTYNAQTIVSPMMYFKIVP